VRACAVVSSFNNPTGASHRASAAGTGASCDTADIALIEDDVYGDISTGARPVPCKALIAKDVCCCVHRSQVAGSGARVGFLTSGRYRDTLRAAKQVQSAPAIYCNRK
jgi:DNA-binding transcriptional MocR family regulator